MFYYLREKSKLSHSWTRYLEIVKEGFCRWNKIQGSLCQVQQANQSLQTGDLFYEVEQAWIPSKFLFELELAWIPSKFLRRNFLEPTQVIWKGSIIYSIKRGEDIYRYNCWCKGVKSSKFRICLFHHYTKITSSFLPRSTNDMMLHLHLSLHLHIN